MIPTLDANVLIYSVDDRDPLKQRAAGVIVDAVQAGHWPIALQVCGEFYHAATRRLGQSRWAAAQAARNLMTSYPTFGASMATTARALSETATGRLSFWDANLLSSAEAAGCTHLISEDMADGLRLGRIEVVHAFENGRPSRRACELLGIEAP